MKKSLEISEMTIEHQFVLREILISKTVKELKYNFALLRAFNELMGKSQRQYNSAYRRLIKISNDMVKRGVLKRCYVYVPREQTKTRKTSIMYSYTISPKWRAENSVELKEFKFCNYLCEYSTVIK